MKVWGRINSTNVRKVLWCLEELGLAYERVDAGGAFGGLDDPGYLAMNPNGLVPCIEDDGLVLWESNAIVRYLAAQYGAAPFAPADARTRAIGDKWMDWTTQLFVTGYRDLYITLVRRPPEEHDPAAIAIWTENCAQLMAMADAALAKAPYLSGDDFGIGDIPLGCIVYGWFWLPIEQPDVPHLSAWYERLMQRPAYRAAVMTPLS